MVNTLAATKVNDGRDRIFHREFSSKSNYGAFSAQYIWTIRKFISLLDAESIPVPKLAGPQEQTVMLRR
jgi:hypothetical protein